MQIICPRGATVSTHFYRPFSPPLFMFLVWFCTTSNTAATVKLLCYDCKHFMSFSCWLVLCICFINSCLESIESTEIDQEIQLSIMPATNPKLGFIGAGMMSSAMINGIIAAKVFIRTVGEYGLLFCLFYGSSSSLFFQSS